MDSRIVLQVKNEGTDQGSMQAKDYTSRVLPLSSKLLRFAGCMLKDGEEARDVVQEVLLKLWEKRDVLDRIANLEAYAMQVTRNRCIDRIRGNRTLPMNREAERSLASRLEEPHDRTEWTDTSHAVLKLIDRLPEQQKSVVYLRDVEQMEYEEIATITGLEINNLRVCLSRARKQVKDELLKLWNHEERRNQQTADQIL